MIFSFRRERRGRRQSVLLKTEHRLLLMPPNNLGKTSRLMYVI